MKYLIRLIIGLVLLAGLLYMVDIVKVFNSLITMPLITLPIFIIMPFLMLIITSINLSLLLMPLGLKESFGVFIKKQFLSRSLGFFVPGKIGELSLSFFLKDSIPMGKSMAAIVIDKINTFVVLSAFAIAGILMFVGVETMYNFLVVFLLSLFLCFFLLCHPLGRGLIKKYLLKKYSSLFTGFAKNVKALLKQYYSFVLLNLFSTVILWAAWGAIIWLIFTQFGNDISIYSVMMIHAMGVLSAFMPISISGLGVRESLVVGLYSLQGVLPEHSATIYLLFLFFSYLMAGSAFVLFQNEWRKSVKDVKEVIANEDPD